MVMVATVTQEAVIVMAIVVETPVLDEDSMNVIIVAKKIHTCWEKCGKVQWT